MIKAMCEWSRPNSSLGTFMISVKTVSDGDIEDEEFQLTQSTYTGPTMSYSDMFDAATCNTDVKREIRRYTEDLSTLFDE